MSSGRSAIFPFAAMLCLAGWALLCAGCSIHASGDIKIYHLEKPRTRYGISFVIPTTPEQWRPPRYTYLPDWGRYWTPFDTDIAYSRRDRRYPAGFSILFVRRDLALGSDGWKNQVVKAIKFPPGSRWQDKDITGFQTVDGEKWGRECVFFEMNRFWSNEGDYGRVNRDFGIFFPHLEDEEVLVLIQFGESFVPPRGEQADRTLDEYAEQLYESVQFVPLTNEEHEQMRAGKWIAPDVW